MLDRSFLSRLGQAESAEQILALLESQDLGLARLASLEAVTDPARPYARNVLGQSEDCEIMLARWSAGRECAPHDHGRSGGFVLFLTGHFVETHYALDVSGLRATQKREFAPGTIVKVKPFEVHSCRALEGGASLHIYFPPIEGMHVYDLENKEVLTVAGSAGAWVPQPPELVLSRARF